MSPYRTPTLLAPPAPGRLQRLRRALVDALPWLRALEACRRWAGGRWSVAQRSRTVVWQCSYGPGGDVWLSGEWEAVDACPCASPVHRRAVPSPDEPHRAHCACEVWP